MRMFHTSSRATGSLFAGESLLAKTGHCYDVSRPEEELVKPQLQWDGRFKANWVRGSAHTLGLHQVRYITTANRPIDVFGFFSFFSVASSPALGVLRLRRHPENMHSSAATNSPSLHHFPNNKHLDSETPDVPTTSRAGCLFFRALIGWN